MSVYLRLVVGPIVVCDIELFGTVRQPSPNDPPPQLAGGTGTVLYPDDPGEVRTFGFRGST